MTEPSCRNLRVEHLERPLMLETTRPRFSWIVEHAQDSYRLQVRTAAGDSVWDSGLVTGNQTTLVEYSGQRLEHDTDYLWVVHSHSGDAVHTGESSFATTPDLGAWEASWIEPIQDPTHLERHSFLDWILGKTEQAPAAQRLRPAQLVRQEVAIRPELTRARLYATAHGVYSAWINGREISDEVLAPGFDSYRHRLSVQAYDVLELLESGQNTLGFALADGWWAGRIGITGSSAQFGDRLGLTWQLHLGYTDGSTEVLTSDSSARSATGPWNYSDLFIGEHYDARLADTSWLQPGFAQESWAPVNQLGVDATGFVPFRGEPIRRVAQLPVVSVEQREGALLLDFGQVIAGRVRLKLRGQERGTQIMIEHTETIDANGDWFQNILGANKEQTNHYICAGDPVEEWEPEFTFHGFRYVRVTGLDSLDPGDVTAIALSSDLEQTGEFSTSDARLNRLHQNVVWSQRANFLSIPTDCPQREKAGWTGDAQVFAAAASNNAGVYTFLSRWLDNLRADQLEDGRVPIVSPRSEFDDLSAAEAPGVGAIVAAAGWSDAVAIVPWKLYERYADPKVLEENYAAVGRWITYQATEAQREIPESLMHLTLSPERQARQRLLYNTGLHFGDWLTPSTLEGDFPLHEAMEIAPRLTSELIAPMFQIHTLDLAARMAEVLGHQADAEEYSLRATEVRGAFCKEYVGEDSTLPVQLQGLYALALGLEILPESHRHRAGEHLAALVRARGNRLDTGFLSTPYLLDALWDTGHQELARAVLWQDQAPSWLYEVDRGATTIWEAWDAVDPSGAPRPVSMNHYAFGCVDDWLFRKIAGLTPTAPGWREVCINPDISCGLQHAEAGVQTPFGPLAVSWQLDNEHVVIDTVVPHGITGVLQLADQRIQLTPGTSQHRLAVLTPAI
ncbi:family 78 glycoside hydrolase catalytic domain [Glutamicibacter sp. NPDC087344]|uniref:alpha-L-rhamnosidase n=1 Tax=Glutamicibacter sp. NPDC087344 TaxID=3363994 RepID=UPI00382ADFE6